MSAAQNHINRLENVQYNQALRVFTGAMRSPIDKMQKITVKKVQQGTDYVYQSKSQKITQCMPGQRNEDKEDSKGQAEASLDMQRHCKKSLRKNSQLTLNQL